MATKKSIESALIVVSFGSGKELSKLFDSLSQSSHIPARIVVVENGPEIPSVTVPKKASLTLVHLPHNPGYGSAVNEGMKKIPADIPWVFVSNPDVTLEPEALERLLDAASRDPLVGSAGPALVNPDGTIYPSARAIPGLWMGIGHALLGPIWKSNPWTKAYRGTYDSSEPRECGWVSGALFLVNKEAFMKIGGFDTSYFMFMEDVDLGMRLGHAGFKNLYVPQARATHLVGHATSNARIAMTTAHHESAKRFIEKRYPGRASAPLRWVLKTGLTLRAFLANTSKRLTG